MATTVDNPFDTQPAKTTNAGIVGSAMTQAPTTTGGLPSNVGTTSPATPSVATYAPTTRQVDQPTGTVQGQVNSILSKDSPLMTRARSLATQQMAQRGLVNSSMAQGAGVSAMIDKATPIASQDAATYNQVAAENANTLNQAGQFNAGEINKVGQQVSQQNFQGKQAELDRAQQSTMQSNQNWFQGQQASFDRSQQSTLQTNQQAFQGQQATLDRNQQSSLQTGQQEFQAGQTKIQNDFSTTMQKLQESGMDFRQARDIASREATTNLEQAGITNRFDKELALKSSQFSVEQTNLERRQILANQMELDKMGLQLKAANAQIPTQFAATVSNTVMQGVSTIYMQPMSADGKPSAAERAAQVQSLMNYANSQIAWGERFYSTVIPRISA